MNHYKKAAKEIEKLSNEYSEDKDLSEVLRKGAKRITELVSKETVLLIKQNYSDTYKKEAVNE